MYLYDLTVLMLRVSVYLPGNSNHQQRCPDDLTVVSRVSAYSPGKTNRDKEEMCPGDLTVLVLRVAVYLVRAIVTCGL